MSKKSFRQHIKPFILPAAIVFGFLFYKPLAAVQWVVPYFIFTMLLITFCRVKLRDFVVGRMIWYLLAIQIIGSAMLFFLLRPLNLPLAQAAMICVLCPTATAAPVVTGMLGGSIARVASYSIICNLSVAIVAPALFVVANPEADINFLAEFAAIGMRLAPMIVFPLGTALLLNFVAPRVHEALNKAQSVSFYLWAVSLFLVVGKAVGFVMSEPASEIPLLIAMAIAAALICTVQFYVGRRIGARFGDKISAAQGLGQKNTVLGIWMASSYLDPISSIGPAAYIIWQNLVNSLQLYFKMKKDEHASRF